MQREKCSDKMTQASVRIVTKNINDFHTPWASEIWTTHYSLSTFMSQLYVLQRPPLRKYYFEKKHTHTYRY